MATLAYKTFLGLGTPFTSIAKDSLGKENLIVFAGTDRLKHEGITSPFSFKYNFSGKTYYEIERARLAISSNQYIFLNNGQFYKCGNEAGQPIQSLIIFFGTEFFKQSLASNLFNDDKFIDSLYSSAPANVNFFSRVTIPSARAVALIHLISTAVADDAEAMYMDELLQELVRELCKDQINYCKLVDMQPAKKYSTRLELFRRISIANDYIHANYHQSLHLAELSSLVNMAPYHFMRIFKYNFNKGPYQVITELRLQEAKSLLLGTAIPITEISQKVGFLNLSTFTRLFTRHFFHSPLSFRNNHRLLN